MKVTALILVAAMTVAGCALLPQKPTGEADERNAVWIACVDHEVSRWTETAALVVSHTELQPGPRFPKDVATRQEWISIIFRNKSQPTLDTFADFADKNTESVALPSSMTFATPHTFITKENWLKLWTRKDHNKEIARRYPGAKWALTLSRPGFNQTHTQALMCVGRNLSGDYLLLEKIDGQWKVVARSMAWVT